MPSSKRIRFRVTIAAPVAKVWETMLSDASYRIWTAAFAPGSYFEGSWREGEQIRFLIPSGDGMISEIAENREYRFISIRHLGIIVDGVVDTESPAVIEWAPASENYTFVAVPGGTELIVDQDVTEDFEQHMQAAWPRALELLKQLCEQ